MGREEKTSRPMIHLLFCSFCPDLPRGFIFGFDPPFVRIGQELISFNFLNTMRLAVIGPQNTGKSTFIQDFVKTFPHYLTPVESYRDVIKRKKLSINQQSGELSQKVIRDFLFDQICHNREPNILFDRCVIDNYVYSLALYEKKQVSLEFLNETFDMTIKHLEFLDGIIFIPSAVSVKLVDDDLRDIETKYIDKINRFFIKTLFLLHKHRSIEVFVISGDRKERLKLARDIFHFINYRLRL
jgi:nicotinamide riboside kinase